MKLHQGLETSETILKQIFQKSKEKVELLNEIDNEETLVLWKRTLAGYKEFDPQYEVAPLGESEKWNYTIDPYENTISLASYNGSDIDVTLYAGYEVDGHIYRTKLGATTDEGYTGSTAYLFNNANIETITIKEGIDTTQLTSMGSTFRNCTNLVTVNGLENIDTSNVIYMFSMFYNCPNLQNVNVNGFNMQSCTDVGSMFFGCKSLQSIDVSNWNTSDVIYTNAMFQNCSALTEVKFSDDESGTSWNGTNIKNMANMFNGCTNLTSIDLSKLNSEVVTDVSQMFRGCINLQEANLSSMDMSHISGPMGNLFRDCNNITAIIFPDNINTSKATSMSCMFTGCNKLTSLDLSNFDTSNVTDMGAMFKQCKSLETLTLSDKFVTNKVVSIGDMFRECVSLTSLDLTSFDTHNCTNMDYVFRDTPKLTEILVSRDKWVENTYSNMFYNCGTDHVTYVD